MTVPIGQTSSALFPPDSFDVPVFVRSSSPLVPAPRPTMQQVSDAWMTWPAVPGVPPDGDYLVSTTWREILNAAISVGRDIAPWLTRAPELAWREILARRSPLAAYLVRQPTPGGSTGGSAREVLPSVIYSHATENSMRTAFGYHVGMTMAEWACRAQMGLGPRPTPRTPLQPERRRDGRHPRAFLISSGHIPPPATPGSWRRKAAGG